MKKTILIENLLPEDAVDRPRQFQAENASMND